MANIGSTGSNSPVSLRQTGDAAPAEHTQGTEGLQQVEVRADSPAERADTDSVDRGGLRQSNTQRTNDPGPTQSGPAGGNRAIAEFAQSVDGLNNDSNIADITAIQ